MSTKALPGFISAPTPIPRLALVASIAAIVMALRVRLARRRAEIELNLLDDRMLRDIGIDRSEIRSVLTDRTGERIHTAETPC